jgi:hypothetical protein
VFGLLSAVEVEAGNTGHGAAQFTRDSAALMYQLTTESEQAWTIRSCRYQASSVVAREELEMTAKELAEKLDGTAYPVRISPTDVDAAKRNGLVIVYGASDDLMEFEGAVNDEVGCYEGGTAYLTNTGLLENKCEDGCPYFAELKRDSARIVAVWNEDGCSWQYRTSIPHETFTVMEDGEIYCRGIVFGLADAKCPPDSTE